MLSFLLCFPRATQSTFDPPPRSEEVFSPPPRDEEEVEDDSPPLSSVELEAQLPSELVLHVMRFASPSTLAAASRCSFDLLAHNAKLLYRDVELETEAQIRALFSRRDRYTSSRRLEPFLSLSQIRTITTTSLSPLSAIGLSLSRSPDYLSLRLDSITINCPTPYLRHPLIPNIVGSPILPLVNPEAIRIEAVPMRVKLRVRVGSGKERERETMPKTPPSYGTSTTPPAQATTSSSFSSSQQHQPTPSLLPSLPPPLLLTPPTPAQPPPQTHSQPTQIHLLQLHERVETQLSSWDRLSHTSMVSCIVTDHHSILFPRGMWRLSLWREVGLTIDLSGSRTNGGEGGTGTEGEGERAGSLEVEAGRERTLEVWRSVRRRMEGGGNGGGWAGGNRGGNGGGSVEGVGDLEVLVRNEEEREWLRRKFEVWSGWKETKVVVAGGGGDASRVG